MNFTDTHIDTPTAQHFPYVYVLGISPEKHVFPPGRKFVLINSGRVTDAESFLVDSIN